MEFLRNSKPIFIVGAHRSGTTWIGKMLSLSYLTYYLSEIFNPPDKRLGPELIKHNYIYVTPENYAAYFKAVKKYLDLDFTWPNRRGFRRILPSRLIILKHTRNLIGFPRPIMKDPMATMSAEWLAESFNMDTICIIRHPAAFVASLKHWNWRYNVKSFLNQPLLIEDHLYEFTDRLQIPQQSFIEEAALAWLCIYHVLTSYARNHQEWQFWRLEDISSSPVEAFEQIFSQVNLPYTSRIRKLILNYSSDRNPGEAPREDPHLIKRNSRIAQSLWKNKLSPTEIACIREIVEPLSNEYYSDEDWH